MHRMSRFFAAIGFVLLVFGPAAHACRADLLPSPGGQSYPDIAGGVSGTQQYVFDPVKQMGAFSVTSSPFVFMTGPNANQEFLISPTTSGDRTQSLNLTLDSAGHLLSNGSNTFSIYGSVNLNGTSFSGLLLQAKATSFGAQGGTDASFNVAMSVTGGALESQFGPVAFLELHTLPTASFNGTFNHSFSSSLICSNIVGYDSISPTPAPEATPILLLITAGGFWAANRARRKIAERFGREV